MINRSNYEIYFLDYFENRLSETDCRMLHEFLDQNPDLKDEFYSFENITLETESENYPLKGRLKKTEITHSNIHTYLIAECEGDLSINEQNELNRFIQQHPEYEAEHQLYLKTKLKADTVVFENKDSLLKTESIITDSNISEMLIREIEDDLTSEEKKLLNEHAATHPAVAKDRKLYAASKLQPVEVSYPHKGDLKKTIGLYRPATLRYVAGIAAVLIMIFGILFLLRTRNHTEPVAYTNQSKSGSDTLQQVKNTNDSLNDRINKIKHNDLVLPVSKSPQRILLAGQGHTPEQPVDRKQTTNSNQLNQDKIAVADTGLKNSNVIHLENQLPQSNETLAHNETVSADKQPISSSSDYNNNELTIGQALNKITKAKLEQIAGKQDQLPDDPTMNSKRNWLDRTAWVVNKIGGRKVKMTNKFTTSNDHMNTEVTAGMFSIEHVSGQ